MAKRAECRTVSDLSDVELPSILKAAVDRGALVAGQGRTAYSSREVAVHSELCSSFIRGQGVMVLKSADRRSFLLGASAIALAGPLAACSAGGSSFLGSGSQAPSSGLRLVKSAGHVELLDSHGVVATGTRRGSSLVITSRKTDTWNVDMTRPSGTKSASTSRQTSSDTTPVPIRTSLRLPSGDRFGFGNPNHAALRATDGTLMQFQYTPATGQTRYSGGPFGTGVTLDAHGNPVSSPAAASLAHGRSVRDEGDSVSIEDPADWPDGGDWSGIGVGPIGYGGGSSGSYPPSGGSTFGDISTALILDSLLPLTSSASRVLSPQPRWPAVPDWSLGRLETQYAL